MGKDFLFSVNSCKANAYKKKKKGFQLQYFLFDFYPT